MRLVHTCGRIMSTFVSVCVVGKYLNTPNWSPCPGENRTDSWIAWISLWIQSRVNTFQTVRYSSFLFPLIYDGYMRLYTPIHRFKSSDWLREGHMTWIIFNNVHGWKLIHVCYFLLFPWLLKELSYGHSCRIWMSVAFFADFMVRYGLKKSMNGVYKKNWLLFYSGNGRKLLYPW